MVNYTKHQHISSLSATSTTDGVKDGADNIHSGIIKALELAAAGTAVLDYGSSVFQQTAGSTRTQFGVSGAIKYMREGVVTSATPSAVELGADPDASNDRYDMIVIQVSDGNFAVRQGTAASSPRVPDNLTAGDIPVALVKVTAGAASTKNATDRPVQLYGFDKSSNSINLGYNSSGYTEAGNITGSASGITVTPTLGGVIIDKDRASTVVSAEDITSLKIDFDRATQDSGTAAHNDIGIDLDVSSSSKGTSTAIGMDVDVVGAGSGTQTVTGLDVTVSGGDTNYAALFNGGNVGIGETTPDAPLHIKYALDSDTTPLLLLESTSTSGSTSPDIKLYRNSSSPADDDSIATLIFSGKNDAGSPEEIDYAQIFAIISDYTDGTEDGTLVFRTKVAGSDNDTMVIKDGRVGIGSSSPDGELHISGAGHQLLTIEREANSNGYGTGIHFQLGDSASATAGHDYAAIYGGIEDNTNGSEDGQLVFQTSTNGTNSTKMFIDSTGKVGIGTDDPAQPLHVERLSSSTENLMVRLRDSSVNAVGERIGIEGYWNTVPAGDIEWELRNTSTGATDIVFSPHSGSGTTNEGFRITSDGKIRVAGNVIQASDGGTTITMDTSDNVSVAGGITAGTTVTATTGLLTNGYFSNGAFEDIYSGSGTDAIVADKSVIISTDAGGATKQYTLPSASGLSGRTITFKNVGTGNTTIAPVSVSEKIDHDATTHALIGTSNLITLPPWQSITLMAFSDGLISQGPAAGTTGWLTLN